MDAVRLLVAGAALAELEAAGELGVDRGGEPRDLLVVEILRERVRRELRLVEDLVRPRAADAGDRALVAQQRVQAPPFAAEDRRQLGGVDAGRLRAEVRELAFGRVRREKPHAGALPPRVLGEDELRAAGELEGERRDLRPLVAGAQRLQPARRHQVDEEHELAVVGGEEEALAAPLDAAEAPAFERGERRVERLQRRDVRRAGLRDREGRHRVTELAPPGLHLRVFGHPRAR